MMNLVKRVYLYILALAVLSGNLNAQERHEISVHLAGGLSTLNSKMATNFDIGNKHKPGGNAGVGYAYNFSPLFALQTGAELSYYESRYNLRNINGNYVVSREDGNILFSYELSGYEEKAKAAYLSIPVMARFTIPLGPSLKFHIAGGAKAGIRIDGKYTNSYDRMRTTGVYVAGGEILDTDPLADNPEQGFGTYTNGESKGDIRLKVMYTASAETGLSYMLSKRFSLFAGGYCDYGLNDIKKNENKDFIQYNGAGRQPVQNNGMLNSVNKRDLEAMPLAKEIHPLAIGLKLKIAYHF